MRFSSRFNWPTTSGWNEAERWERMVQNILLRSAAELRRRQQSVDLLENVVSWARPALVAACGLVGLSLVVIRQVDRTAADASPALFRTSSLPAALETWLESSEPPFESDLYIFSNERE